MDSLIAELMQLGVEDLAAQKLHQQIQNDLNSLAPEACWHKISKELIQAKYPFPVHQLIFRTIYPDWEDVPRAAWSPDENISSDSNISKLIREKNCRDYKALHAWSVQNYQNFWLSMLKLLSIQLDQPYSQLVDLTAGIESPKWFPDAKLNIANSCFQTSGNQPAIISQTETGDIVHTSYDELDKLSNRIANSLQHFLKKGEKAAIIMPMTKEAVAIYLGIVKAGCVVVAIPDSFVADEIATRLRIAGVKAVFCQDMIIRDGKVLPLYERIINAAAPLIIVLPADKKINLTLRPQDLNWKDFLKENNNFTPVSCDPHDHINILFSSGTTGEPKAIPWTHATVIKCGSDAYLHHNVKPGDVFCWPTNLGWMMGPWLIFASLLNHATIALYDGSPNGRRFGEFIQNAKVTQLGLVPTLVRTWRNSACMEGLDWQTIKLFTSTGERSNTDDMLYLMYLADYKPIIEYCGGTEIGGGYITGTVVQPAAPAAFTTAALGLDFILLDENGLPSDNGEVAIVPPSLGLSTELLNKDHHKEYYAGMPLLDSKILRRHGDQAKRYPNGFYRLLGRSDDTVKLGGIKVSSAEIEMILNALPTIYETAAIAINPENGGPSQLVIYVVLKTETTIAELKTDMQQLIKQHLNPLFKIYDVVVIDALPRTASNKVMRRVLRDQYKKNQNKT